MFIIEQRGGIGGGSGVCGVSLSDGDFDDGEKNSNEDTVCDGLLLKLLPFINRRPMGGLRSFI